MGRLLILVIPLMLLLFGGGIMVGRAGKRRAIAQATKSVRPLVQATRVLVDIDPVNQPASYSLHRSEARFALGEYDDSQRKALNE